MLSRGINPDITDLTATVSVVESLRLDDELQEIKDILKLKKLKESRSAIRSSTRYNPSDLGGLQENSESPESDPSVISISPGEYDDRIPPKSKKSRKSRKLREIKEVTEIAEIAENEEIPIENIEMEMKQNRIRKQKQFHRIVKKSNRKTVEYLKKTLDSAIESGGVDIYTYFNFIGEISHKSDQPPVVEKKHRLKRFLISFPTKFYKIYTAVIVIAIQLIVPCVLLVSQLRDVNFQPVDNSGWFRLVGFLVMSYSVADLRSQIMGQVNWIMIDNNKIIGRISKKIKRPRIPWLYIGLYTNMIMSLVVSTNIYLLYCASESIIDLILNTVALNFLLLIDNSAFNMLVNNSDVMNIVKARAREQIDTMYEKANFHEIRIVRRMHPTLEYYMFYLVSLYTIVLPFIFLLYNTSNISADIGK
jgi:hypothetical protein